MLWYGIFHVKCNLNVVVLYTGTSCCFQIVAREVGTKESFTRSAFVTVRLKDVNDNAPRFDKTNFDVKVREDQKTGDTILRLTVSALDIVSMDDITF